MSTIKSVYLQHLNGTTPNATMDTNGNFTVGGTVSGASSNMFRNRIINGDMRIDQRNSGASVTGTAGIVYPVDRFAIQCSQASKVTGQQGSSSPPTGFTNYLGVTSSSSYSVVSTDYFHVYQAIEGLNVADLNFGTANAKTVTLSFWVKSSLTGTFGAALSVYDASRSYPFNYTISSANTWTYITVTIPGDTSGTWPTTNAGCFLLRFSLGAGSNYSTTANAWAAGNYTQPTGSQSVVGTNGATFQITGVQLEAGTTATSFEVRSYGQELVLCQRYYETIICGSGTPNNFFLSGVLTGGNCTHTCYYKVTKRAAPTFSLIGGGVWQNTPNNMNIGIDSAVFQNTTSGYFYAGNGAGTGAAFSIEL